MMSYPFTSESPHVSIFSHFYILHLYKRVCLLVCQSVIQLVCQLVRSLVMISKCMKMQNHLAFSLIVQYSPIILATIITVKLPSKMIKQNQFVCPSDYQLVCLTIDLSAEMLEEASQPAPGLFKAPMPFAYLYKSSKLLFIPNGAQGTADNATLARLLSSCGFMQNESNLLIPGVLIVIPSYQNNTDQLQLPIRAPTYCGKDTVD